MKYRYARVRSSGQGLSVQLDALKRYGCETIRKETVLGTTTQGREELNLLLEFLREGGELVIIRIDRLARSIRDLQNIIHILKTKGVSLKATEQPIDTSSSAGKAFLDMLGVFAEFEANLRKERQMKGIAKAKAQGVYKDRKCKIDPDEANQLRAEGLGATLLQSNLILAEQVFID